MKRIGVLTSGGDGPGLNPCIRAVVRMAVHYDIEVTGIKRGYSGLIDHEVVALDSRSVGSGMISQGGTRLGTSRCLELKTVKGQREALRTLNEEGIEGLVVIGGDGSMRGAKALHDAGVKVIGIPGSIDNDVLGTDICIGVDTALNTVMDAIDRIKDTASSHNRAFLIETMGRNCGYIAMVAGIIGGAEMVCLPEVPFELEDVVRELMDTYVRGKSHCIIVVAEGAKYNAKTIAEHLESRDEQTGFEVRMTILGYIQRGGSPSAFDRLLATRLGAAAVDVLHEGKAGVMAGLQGAKIEATPLAEVVATSKKLNLDMYELGEVLSV